MKIGTWNLERLKYSNKIVEITSLLENQNCDILVLTEYDERIKPKGFEFEISTKSLTELNSEFILIKFGTIFFKKRLFYSFRAK